MEGCDQRDIGCIIKAIVTDDSVAIFVKETI